MPITISNSFGYCVLSTGASWFAASFGAIKVSSGGVPHQFALSFPLPSLFPHCSTIQVVQARKKYDVQYPALYAPPDHKYAKEFNCVQRAHQNTLESWASVQVLTIVNGIVFPVTSAICNGIWVVGRFIYIQGYGTGDPDKRMLGAILSHVGDLPLLIMTFVSGYTLIKGSQ
jgi:glutathione S-transferase